MVITVGEPKLKEIFENGQIFHCSLIELSICNQGTREPSSSILFCRFWKRMAYLIVQNSLPCCLRQSPTPKSTGDAVKSTPLQSNRSRVTEVVLTRSGMEMARYTSVGLKYWTAWASSPRCYFLPLSHDANKSWVDGEWGGVCCHQLTTFCFCFPAGRERRQWQCRQLLRPEESSHNRIKNENKQNSTAKETYQT